ncbi:Hydroxymethylpyrimidine pyrophosphatase [Cryobacterium psychrotolerans]|uniref:Hydroxymethylpyrimidine pyrophosphatase n=1 Tax=Cryobacterium psychrotolerans TaxID=386301 RepID=A0A1G9G7P0_9MICO|nr:MULTISPECIES: HAD hydrolase family protein [Cryobacterium]SDK96293.1 Hydroxymethylpyrimidine pyrophosphatase [Cryobacterium psychrotolerans]
MTNYPRLVAFDLDDTLAPSKSPLDPRMAALMLRLLDVAEVCVISGGQLAQFRMQVVDTLEGATASQLERLHLMPTCGTQYYRFSDGVLAQVYAQSLFADEKKNRLRAAVQALLPDLEVRSGGSTSVDITRRGIDKAYGMTQLAELTGVPLDDMLFVGDRLDPDGNDYPVKALGVACHSVRDWQDTAGYLETLIPTLLATPARAGA